MIHLTVTFKNCGGSSPEGSDRSEIAHTRRKKTNKITAESIISSSLYSRENEKMKKKK